MGGKQQKAMFDLFGPVDSSSRSSDRDGLQKLDSLGPGGAEGGGELSKLWFSEAVVKCFVIVHVFCPRFNDE